MSTSQTQIPNYLYDLSNPHFEKVELTLADGKQLKGQFVQFKILKGDIEYLYPSEKYCFVPEDQKKLFWREYDRNDGAFKEIPACVVQLSMAHIKQISISPVLVP
jgi:hypothetical protein